MDFPKQTLELADRVASEIKSRRGTNPANLAAGLYQHLNNRFDYGILEGVVQGTFIRWPHEIRTQWECIEAGVYVYAIAEALGLNPRLISANKWNGLDTGHDLVDVQINGHRVLVDPLNDLFGKVTYTNDGATVEPNETTRKTALACRPTVELPRSRIIARVEHLRSDEGIMDLLQAGQSYSTSPIHSMFLSYDRGTQVLTMQARAQAPFSAAEYFTQEFHLTAEGAKAVVQEQGLYKSSNWKTLVGKEPYWRRVMNPIDDTETMVFLPFKAAGYLNLLLTELYGALWAIKFPEAHAKKDYGRNYLFDGRELPFEALAMEIDKARESAKSPLEMARYQQLRRAYIASASIHQQNEDQTERVLDKATFDKFVEMLARENGINPITFCKNLLGRLGMSESDISKARIWDPFGMPMTELFPTQELGELVDRWIEDKLIR
ncbi:hypothetical protein HYX05_03635 [Candidatus Woesearchaeota archaeon]|nr:hypothetical protein [Candidatus Woesearchaeota archaeon]